MTRAQGRLDLWIEFTSDWHVGVGAGIPGGVDRVVQRDERGAPVVPAATLAGIVRASAEDVALGLDEGVDGPWNRRVVRLFGGFAVADRPPVPSLLRFSDARVADVIVDDTAIDVAELVCVRASTAIDPVLGVARQRTLRTVEVGRAGLVLGGVMDHPTLDAADHFLILAAMRHVRAIGARRRRGLGRCLIHVNDPTDLADLWSEVSDPLLAPEPAGPSVISVPAVDRTARLVTFELVVALREPVAAQERRLANELTSHDFVPGSLLLAALDGALDRALSHWVAAGLVAVGDLVPAWESDAGPVQCLPTPRCLFLPKEADAQDGYQNRIRVAEATSTQMKGARSGWTAVTPQGGLADVEVAMSSVAHAVISDEQRPTSEGGGLFIRHVIDAGQVFVGRVVVPEPVSRLVKGLAGSDLRLGRGSSRGQGLVHIALVRRADTEPASVAVGDEAVVLAAADVLLRTATNRLAPDAALLATAMGAELVSGPGAQSSSFIGVRRRDSWHGQWGLPRPSLVALAAGSVARLRILDPERFEEALRRGVGERTAEGFGRVVRADFLEKAEIVARAAPRPVACASEGRRSVAPPEVASTQLDRLLGVLRSDSGVLAFDAAARNQARELARSLELDRISPSQLGELRRCARLAAVAGTLDPVWGLLRQLAANASRRARWGEVPNRLAKWLAENDPVDDDIGDDARRRCAIGLGLAARSAQQTASLGNDSGVAQ
jgi:CRISPR-associated protein Csx10